MPDLATLALFVPVALALNLTPGADMMFALGQGLRSGRAGVMAALGVSAGGMIHALAAGLGLAALVAAYPAAYEIIRWAGVAYLLWLALGALRDDGTDHAARAVPNAFRQGLVVNVLNPKVGIFMLALVPQFVDPTRPILPQFLVFGLVIATGGALVNGSVGLLAGRLRHRLTGRRSDLTRYGTAGLYAALAIGLARQSRAV